MHKLISPFSSLFILYSRRGNHQGNQQDSRQGSLRGSQRKSRQGNLQNSQQFWIQKCQLQRLLRFQCLNLQHCSQVRHQLLHLLHPSYLQHLLPHFQLNCLQHRLLYLIHQLIFQQQRWVDFFCRPMNIYFFHDCRVTNTHILIFFPDVFTNV